MPDLLAALTAPSVCARSLWFLATEALLLAAAVSLAPDLKDAAPPPVGRRKASLDEPPRERDAEAACAESEGEALYAARRAADAVYEDAWLPTIDETAREAVAEFRARWAAATHGAIDHLPLYRLVGHARIGRYLSGVDALFEAIERTGVSASSHLYCERGLLRQAKGDFARARDDFVRAFQRDRHHGSALLHYGMLHLPSSDTIGDGFSALCQAVRCDERDPCALLYRARFYLFVRQWTWDFDEALDLGPRRGRALCGRALQNHVYRRFERARADFDLAVAADPRDVDSRFDRACWRLSCDDADGVLDDANAILGCDAAHTGARILRGIVLCSRANRRDAVAECLAIDAGRWRAATYVTPLQDQEIPWDAALTLLRELRTDTSGLAAEKIADLLAAMQESPVRRKR